MSDRRPLHRLFGLSLIDYFHDTPVAVDTEHYAPRSPETSTLLYELFRAYSEDPNMPDKLKEFVRQSIDELLERLPAEERLKGLPAEERLKGLPAEELSKRLSPKERLKGLSADEVVQALPPDIVEARRYTTTDGTDGTDKDERIIAQLVSIPTWRF